MLLDKINCPNDLKKLDISDLPLLSEEIRDCIVKKVNTTGGHFAPNLGFVEASIAIHYVFNSPVDKIVFDVSHQCYPHKILTERKEGFINPDKYLKYTGYSAPEESLHDVFKIGHTSTSITLALGLAKARDLNGENYNVIAVIGDGSLSGGEAFEGLNNAGVLNSNIIIIVNDNEMSIAENQGGLYENLKLLRETKGKSELNFFKAMGFDYQYLEEGNNTKALIELFKSVKDINHPVILHIKTLKGKGILAAEQNKEAFHWIVPGGLDNFGKENNTFIEDNNSITRDFLLEKAKTNKNLVAITAATPGAVGFDKNFRQKMGKQYVDVGIAEQHAVGFAASLAKGGAKPVLFILSSFVQRAYDQLSQDLALNKAPAVLLINWCGISGQDATHLGVFDIPLISNIPNIVYLAPSNREEYLKMLDFSINQTEFPVAIRVPLTTLMPEGKEDNTDYSILNKFKTVQKGAKVAIIGAGDFVRLAVETSKLLKEQTDIEPTIINPCFLSGLDTDLLDELKKDTKLVVTLENGVLSGGFGEKISAYYGSSNIKVLNFGAQKEFTDRISPDELYKKWRLRADLITEDIKQALKS
ncbi:MAG: 1-deoxy-D-xylulose-5-phosphate synthase [Candidatus Gastranaerophilales bacterium]|nr:1-deoxy-D-xylulose-5-phosphate synthase [Candidatus Gastranaerophilales bacterium]